MHAVVSVASQWSNTGNKADPNRWMLRLVAKDIRSNILKYPQQTDATYVRHAMPTYIYLHLYLHTDKFRVTGQANDEGNTRLWALPDSVRSGSHNKSRGTRIIIGS